VDSSPAWIATVREATADQAERVTIKAIDLGELGGWGYPTTYRHRFRDYMNSPWTQGSVKPDLVLIDGRFRVACFLHSLLVAEAGPPSSSTTTPTILLPPGGGVLPDQADGRPTGAVPRAGRAGSRGDWKGAGGVIDGEGLRAGGAGVGTGGLPSESGGVLSRRNAGKLHVADRVPHTGFRAQPEPASAQ